MTLTPEKCRRHAKAAARQSVMRGLDQKATGICFLAEGLKLIYENLADHDALILSKLCSAYAADLLIARAVNQAKQDGASEADMAILEEAAANARSRAPDN